MQRVGLFVIAWSLCCGNAGSALALTDGPYRGTLSCVKMPFTKGPQQVSFLMQVTGGAVTYTRTVKNEDNTAVAGTETGTGTVAPNGTTRLTGGWRGTRDSYSASYGGTLAAGGGRLTGQQNWTYKGQNYTRDCSITFRR